MKTHKKYALTPLLAGALLFVGGPASIFAQEAKLELEQKPIA